MRLNDLMVFSSGIFFGTTGLLFEVGGNLQSSLRIIVIILAEILLLFSLNLKIDKKYFFPIVLFLIYFSSVCLSIVINNSSISYFFREAFFFGTVIVLYILLSNEEKVNIFFKGFMISFIILNAYYFFQIDFSQLMDPLYRKIGEYGANGVGKIAGFSIIFLVYFMYVTENKFLKVGMFILFLTSFIVITGAKSRTSIAMLFVAWLLMSYAIEKKRMAIISVILLFVVIVVNIEMLTLLIRLDDVTSTGEQNIYTLTGRTDIWHYGIELIKNNILFGIGPDRLESLTLWGEHITMDNSYLFIYLNSGALGFLSVLFVVFISFYNAISSLKFKSFYSILFLSGLLNTIVGISLTNIGTPDNFIIFFLLLMFSGINMKFLQSKEDRRYSSSTKRIL